NNPGGFPLPTDATVTGSWTWTATYGGDRNNKPASDQGGSGEQTVVSKASPSIVTTASPAVTLGTTAPTLNASAALAVGYFETGTITFKLLAPAVAPSTGTASYTDVITIGTNSGAVTGNGPYTTLLLANNPGGFPLPTDATVTGSWTWTA